jgi:hypothetical protein
MELRYLVSSVGSAENFDLCCLVRNKMIKFLQTNYPHALPTLRLEMREPALMPAEPAPDPDSTKAPVV